LGLDIGQIYSQPRRIRAFSKKLPIIEVYWSGFHIDCVKMLIVYGKSLKAMKNLKTTSSSSPDLGVWNYAKKYKYLVILSL
jgi:hypothetical protein